MSKVKRLALVTGASSGIGAAFAEAFAGQGCDVCLVARRLDRLEALANEMQARFGIEAFCIQADLSQPSAISVITEALSARGRDVDILVNNAGYSLAQEFLATTGQQQSDFVQVLVASVVSLTHALLPSMAAKGYGRIINVGSMVAFSPGAAGHTLYPAAKSFVVKMSQSLAAEVSHLGIKVTAICPGQTVSEFSSVNGTSAAIAKSGLYQQTAQAVVETAIAANEAGHEVVVPGWPNKIAVLAMKLLPDNLVAAIIRPQARKFSIAHKNAS
jgi:short-subunit dehydrogenase